MEVAPFLLEASEWVGSESTFDVRPAPGPERGPRADQEPGAVRARVLVADDNTDMRAYLVRLLSARWDVEAVADGAAALASAQNAPPDLVLSDVMMPRLDGVALLAALRAHPPTRHVPVVLLSARAGEESVLKGLETGADDYLVKPFAARELLARVQTHLNLAQLRRAWSDQLERANHELEAFSYSVSHDLRAPLRAIDGFSKALLLDHAHQLDGQSRQHLDQIRAAAQRMGRLIDDLLALSRVTRTPIRRERVNLSELARAILQELAAREGPRNVTWNIADSLEAAADPGLVRVLLENLLSNAWKFTRRQAAATIDVGLDARGAETVFFVRDSGVGFDPQHATKLFAPFRRFHSEREFEGTGIGLATVARVATRHGGRVWADAAPDQGATFFFTLGGASAPG